MTARTESRASIAVRLTETGAAGLDNYQPGQLLELPEPAARYFIRHGWAVEVDHDQEQERTT